MNWWVIFFITGVIGQVANGTQEEAEITTTESEETADRFGGGPETTADRFMYFDIDLIQRLHKEAKDNFVISPASIKSILALIVEGAEGRTAAELLSLLRLPTNKANALARLHEFQKQMQNPNAGVTLKSGNRIVVSKEVKLSPGYQETAANEYSAQISSADFRASSATAKSINDWVNTLTQGFIPMLVNPDSLDPNSLIVLVNAMYFKGEWRTKFDPKETEVQCFYPQPNNCIKTNMMITGDKFKYGFVNGLQARIVELPYNDERYSMVLVLPEEKGGLSGVVRDLPYNQILKTIEKLEPVDVIVQLPRFTVDFDVQLPPLLEKAGVKAIFSDKANLSGMISGKSGGKISNIVHKAKIVVNEKGTTAGAGTSAVVVPLMTPKGGEFIANRPFLFFIKDSVSGILFGGQFVRPSDSPTQHEQAPQTAGGVSQRPTEEEGTSEGQLGGNRPQVTSQSYPPRPRPPQRQPMRDAIQFPR